MGAKIDKPVLAPGACAALTAIALVIGPAAGSASAAVAPRALTAQITRNADNLGVRVAVAWRVGGQSSVSAVGAGSAVRLSLSSVSCASMTQPGWVSHGAAAPGLDQATATIAV